MQKTQGRGSLRKKIMNEEIKEIQQLNNEQLRLADEQGNYSTFKNLLFQMHGKIKGLSEGNNRKEAVFCYAVYYYNLAYLHQKLEKISNAQSALENCISNYQYLKGFISSREENINYCIQISKLYLQHCAILSHGEKHATALIYAEKGLEKLIQCFRGLQAICCQEQNLTLNTKRKSHSTDFMPKIQKINFKDKVLEQANTILQELTQLSPLHKILGSERQHFQKIMQNIYFWKNNTENNEKNIRKELEIDFKNPDRNILGLHKTSKSTDNFHIGLFMSLKRKKMFMNFKTDRYYLLSSEKLFELALLVSVSYFTLATQIRFNHDLDIQSLTILQKYKILHHNEQIQKCKILHLKAIQIAGKYLPLENQYFNHLLQSFNKNYKPVMDQIEEVSEITNIEEIKIEEKNNPSYQYGLSNIKKEKVKRQKGSGKEKMEREKSEGCIHTPQKKKIKSKKVKKHSSRNSLIR